MKSSTKDLAAWLRITLLIERTLETSRAPLTVMFLAARPLEVAADGTIRFS